jgi:hypothetical protein
MALTYATYEDVNLSTDGGDVTTTSRTYNSGELVVILWVVESNAPSIGTVSCTNSGTAQTWNDIATVSATDYCYVRGWWCVMSTTQAVTITVASDSPTSARACAYTIVHAGQNATTPIPAGKVQSGQDADGDVSLSITPTATGSCLWLLCGDWANSTDTFTAGANCTKQDSHGYTDAFAAALIRPTTQPRDDANAFTISETDTSGKLAYLAFEVVAAGGGASIVPQAMANYRMRAA